MKLTPEQINEAEKLVNTGREYDAMTMMRCVFSEIKQPADWHEYSDLLHRWHIDRKVRLIGTRRDGMCIYQSI